MRAVTSLPQFGQSPKPTAQMDVDLVHVPGVAGNPFQPRVDQALDDKGEGDARSQQHHHDNRDGEDDLFRPGTDAMHG